MADRGAWNVRFREILRDLCLCGRVPAAPGSDVLKGLTAAIRRVSHQWLIRGGGKSNGELRRRFCHLGVYPLAVLQRCLVWLTHRLWGRTGAYLFATQP